MSLYFAKRILIVQQNITATNPNTTTTPSSLSNPPTKGEITITPRKTCPALSKIFAILSSCVKVNTAFLGNRDINRVYHVGSEKTNEQSTRGV